MFCIRIFAWLNDCKNFNLTWHEKKNILNLIDEQRRSAKSRAPFCVLKNRYLQNSFVGTKKDNHFLFCKYLFDKECERRNDHAADGIIKTHR